MNKIKTGLAAYGMSGQVFHAPFISTNPHFELTAITERSKNLARASPHRPQLRRIVGSGRSGTGRSQHSRQFPL